MGEGVFAGEGKVGVLVSVEHIHSLWARVGSSQSISSIVAFVGTVTLLPAMEAESFSDTPRSFHRGQFGEGNSINVHGIGVVSGLRGVDSRGESSFL